jgi:hypothetical protein
LSLYQPKAIAVAALCALALVSPAAADLLGGSFLATPPAFSPNGDGRSDASVIRFTLADTVAARSLVVFAADSVTPVDTLIAPAPDSVLGPKTATWDGRRWDGTPAPEGSYVVTVSASDAAGDTTATIPLFVDLTAPTLRVTGVTPARYVPGVPNTPSVLDISFVLTGVSPVPAGRVPDELQLTIHNPSGAPLSAETLNGRISWDPPLLSLSPPSVGTDGTYHLKWDAGGQTGLLDGEYRIDLSIVDAAGFTDADTAYADFDVDRPNVTYTNLQTGDRVAVVPDSLRGRAYDRSGIDSLRVKYSASGAYTPVPSFRVVRDTVVFAVALADSIPGEGSHDVTVRATDGVGRVTAAKLTLVYDATRPGAPSLEPFDGVWYAESFTVRGEVPPDAEVDGRVRILRNAVQVDSVFTALDQTFARPIPLDPGENLIYAIYLDGADNASPPSNTIRVLLDDASGLYMPVPFRRNDQFVVNTSQAARRVEVSVYDLTGDLVVVLESQREGENFELPWNGLNRSGASVKKGPLVAVATVTFADGSRTRYREIFLFEDAP